MIGDYIDLAIYDRGEPEVPRGGRDNDRGDKVEIDRRINYNDRDRGDRSNRNDNRGGNDEIPRGGNARNDNVLRVERRGDDNNR